MKLILLNVIVGAIIGLFTNWIAIVMLFRPWTEKKLFGKRLPFTPGLIPSRQTELAEKLGVIVEQDLLTPEGVAKSLRRPALEFAVKRSVIQSVGNTLQETPTLGGLLTRAFGDEATHKVEEFLVLQAVRFLREGEGRAKLESLADALFDHVRQTLAREEVRQSLIDGVAGPLHSRLLASEKTWQDVLPASARLFVEERLRGQVGPLLEGLARWMEEPAFVDAVARMLTEKVESIPLIGAMAKSFLTTERVRHDIVPRLQSVAQSATAHSLVEDKLQSTLGQVWQQPIADTIGKLSGEDFQTLMEKTISSLLDHVLADQEGNRQQFRRVIVDGLLAGANPDTVGDLLHRVLEGVLSYNVRNLYIQHTEQADRLLGQMWQFLRDRMIDGLPDLLEALSVRQIVEEQVGSYPIPTLEKLIISVVNKELKMITLLGGLLGAVIGLVQAMISRL